MERRSHKRYDLSVPVKFDWEVSNGAHQQGTGITRDFSARGVFIMAEDRPPVGTTVHFEVDLDRSRLGSAVTVRAKGQVIRIEKMELVERLGGFAISTRRMRLAPFDTLSEI